MLEGNHWSDEFSSIKTLIQLGFWQVLNSLIPTVSHDNRNLTGSSIYLSNSGQLLTFDNQSDQEVQSSPLKTFFSGKLLISNQQKTDHRFKSWNSGLSLEKIYFWISLTLSVLFCYSIISLCSLSASIPLLFLTGCNTQIRTMAFLFLFGKHRGEEYDFMDSSTVELWKLQLTVEAPNREEHIQDIYDSTDFHASFLC